jgi:hypothetical protein
VVIEEGGQDAPDAADDAGDDAEADAPAAASAGGGGGTDRRRGERVQRGQERRNTILGMPRFLFLTMAGLMVVLVATTIAGQLVDPPDQIAGVEEFSDQGRRHLAAGETFDAADYNSFPPTSGPQAAEGVAPGIYEPGQAPSFAQLLPILERGGIVVYYDPSRLPAADAEELRGFVEVRNNGGWDLLTLVALEDSRLPSPIVATAWRHALAIETLDDDARELLVVFVDPDPAGLYRRFILETGPPAIDES